MSSELCSQKFHILFSLHANMGERVNEPCEVALPLYHLIGTWYDNDCWKRFGSLVCSSEDNPTVDYHQDLASYQRPRTVYQIYNYTDNIQIW